MSTPAHDAAAISAALADSVPTPYWLDRPDCPEPTEPLVGPSTADLVVVGGGFTGLWAAIVAKEADPDRDVMLLEADRAGHTASGRNGGFLSSSLTHGLGNGAARFPEELDRLEALGLDNYRAIGDFVERRGIDCGLRSCGIVSVARRDHELAAAADHRDQLVAHGHQAELLDRDAVRAELDSPAFLGGVWQRTGEGLVDPGRLAWGLRRVALDLGVRLHEGTPATGIADDGAALGVTTADGRVSARRALLGTNAYRSLVPRLRRYTVPVYDYVLVTEPLTAVQRAAVGWARAQGFADLANLFHYYRLTDDGRILWGGYDAEYHFGSRMDPALEDSPRLYAALARRFFATFPQLESVRFSHRWAGAIDTSTRFSAFFAPVLGGKAVAVAGYTGLGVGASRFGARAGLDLLDGRRTELTELCAVRSMPLAFPPEPVRWLGISATKRAAASADRTGRRGWWLRTLDRLGLGFDS